LPEPVTRSAQQSISPFRGDSFHKLGDLRCGNFWFDKKVDVIRHHDKRDEDVQVADSLATPNGLRDTFGDLWLFEPAWTQSCALEFTVGGHKSVSIATGSQWKGAVQSKRNEQSGSIGLKVRKVAAIFQMIPVLRTMKNSPYLKTQAEACATCRPAPHRYNSTPPTTPRFGP
jgi:hypothetical protein